jgi:hypothetical protein
MAKRAWLNLGLMVVVVVLAWIAWREPGHKPAPAAVPLTAIKPDMVDKINLTRHSGGTLTLIKRDGTWWLEAPVRARADAFHVDALLNLLSAESEGSFPAASRDLAAYGFVEPTVRVLFNDHTTLLFGASTPVENRRYVLVGNTIYLLNDSYYYDLTIDPMEFVDRALLPGAAHIHALHLPGLDVTLDSNGRWTVMPAQPKMRADDIQRMIDAWRNARALQVTSYEVQPSQGDVAIELEGRIQPLHLQITARTPELILAEPEAGLQYHFANDEAQRLLGLSKEQVPQSQPVQP